MYAQIQLKKMSNYNYELDELFSSSKEEGQKNEQTPSTIISTQVSSNLNSVHDEFVEQMVNESEMEHEVKIILQEQEAECIGRELVNSVFNFEITDDGEQKATNEVNESVALSDQDIVKELSVTVEFDSTNVISDPSDEDQSSDAIVPKKANLDEELDSFISGIDFKSSVFKRMELARQNAKWEREEKEKRYFVEKVEPRTDFSEYGEWAEIMEAEHKEKYEEYKQNLARIKQLKADDKQKEKLQKEIQREKLAKERSDRKVERNINKLETQLQRQGHYANVIGYNESQTMIKLSIPRTYHRLVDNCGRIIVTSPFIELSNTKPMFYYYSLKQQLFFLYGKSPSNKEYTLMFKASTQEEMWEAIKKVEPVNYAGFSFHKFELFDSSRFY